MILRTIFSSRKTGFYVDVGAHHPQRFSNTNYFYQQGWRGINIDAMPGSMKLFDKLRCRDINLEVGIGEEEGQLEYYIFNEPALNGFSKDESMRRHSAASKYEIRDVVRVKVLPLATVLREHLDQGQVIDFLSVDVEGLDLMVLRSNDWKIFRPACVLAEVLGSDLHDLEENPVVQFLAEQAYKIYAKSGNTVIFVSTP